MGVCTRNFKGNGFGAGTISFLRFTIMKFFRYTIFTILISAMLFPANLFATDQVRTTDLLVTSANTIVSSQVDVPFALYIGDNISPVTNPLKSSYFTISGVYSGGGSLTFSLNSSVGSAQVFTLPFVASPTAFEVLYKDKSGIIAPTSAGGYTYTLNIIPSFGLSISALGATMEETHRFTPATCPDGSSTNEKVKTNSFLVTSSNVAVSGPLSTPVNLYIGDNLAGITNPVKSTYFTMSGIYTGGGTLTFSLNGNAASAQTFTLPSVSAPTYIELLYKDPTNTINPSSGGSYSYTLNAVPSGVAISAFAVTLTETHRYKPGSCSGFPILGDLYSAVFDTTGTSTGPSYNSFLWKGMLGGALADQGKVRFQLAVSDCANGATNYPTCSTGVGSWSFIGGATCSVTDWFDPGAPDTTIDIQANTCAPQFNNHRYFRYVAEICSNDCVTAGNFTPRVEDVVVNWSP